MNVILRNKLKEIYKKSKHEDSVNVGRVINKYVQQVHQELKKKDPNEATLKELTESIAELCKQSRFCKDFPDFPSFKKYVNSNKLSVSDLSF